MADEGRVTYERLGRVGHITVDRPNVRNAMSPVMYTQLLAACDAVDHDQGDGVRVAVVRGAGGQAFVAGTDIARFRGFDGQDGLEYERRIDPRRRPSRSRAGPDHRRRRGALRGRGPGPGLGVRSAAVHA